MPVNVTPPPVPVDERGYCLSREAWEAAYLGTFAEGAAAPGRTRRALARTVPPAPLPGSWRSTLDRALAAGQCRSAEPTLHARLAGVDGRSAPYDPTAHYRCPSCGVVAPAPRFGWRMASVPRPAGAAEGYAQDAQETLEALAADPDASDRARANAGRAAGRVNVGPARLDQRGDLVCDVLGPIRQSQCFACRKG
jgi:hypothetical protein